MPRKKKKEPCYLRKMFLNDKEYEIRKAPFLILFQISIMGALSFIAWTIAIQMWKGIPVKINDIVSFFSMISIYTVNLVSIHKSKANSIKDQLVKTTTKKTTRKTKPKVTVTPSNGPAATNPLDNIII